MLWKLVEIQRNGIENGMMVYRTMGEYNFSQSAGSYTNQTTTLPIAFSSTAYYITLIATNSNNQQSHTCGILVKNKNSFNWSSSYWWARDAYVSSFNWYACGY